MKPHRFQKPFGKDEPMDVKRYWLGILIRFGVLLILTGSLFILWRIGQGS